MNDTSTNRRYLYLIIPPEKQTLEGFSSGLISIANYLRQELGSAVNVEIIDLSRSQIEDLSRNLWILSETLSETFVGITTTTATYQSSLAVARSVKYLNPNAKVILGGHHAQAQSEVILNRQHRCVDFVISGEGEIPLTELLRNYPRLDDVPGLSWREHATGLIRTNRIPAFLKRETLDTLQVWHDGVILGATPGKFGHATYVSARGCHLKCAFCAVANEIMRSKSNEAIIRDLRYLVLEQGIQKIAFENNFFAQNKRDTESLCTAIIEEMEREPRFRFEWDCQTRVESMKSRKLIQLMKRAGCRSVYLGVENFNPAMLRHLGKSGSPDSYIPETHEVSKILAEEGIEVFVNIQIGLPMENEEVRRVNLDNLRSLAQIIGAHGGKLVVFPMLAVVYPGTAHFRDLLLEGVPEDIYETYTLWESKHDEVVGFFGRNFAHGRGGLPTGLLDKRKMLHGEFELIPERLENVRGYLRQIQEVPGLEVFDYSDHLVVPTPVGTKIKEGERI